MSHATTARILARAFGAGRCRAGYTDRIDVSALYARVGSAGAYLSTAELVAAFRAGWQAQERRERAAADADADALERRLSREQGW